MIGVSREKTSPILKTHSHLPNLARPEISSTEAAKNELRRVYTPHLLMVFAKINLPGPSHWTQTVLVFRILFLTTPSCRHVESSLLWQVNFDDESLAL
jgi:hypothetical protein